MPHKDRHKNREIPLEFDFLALLEKIPLKDRLTIMLITDGSVSIMLNNRVSLLKSPCLLCLSPQDSLQIIHSEKLSVKAFHFEPSYIKACLTFENLEDEIEIEENQVYNRKMLYMFTKHTNTFQGIFPLSPQAYIHINELLLLIGAEIYSQSDGFWTCRIRRWLLQLINYIYDMYVDRRKLKFYELPERNNPVTICVEYIQQNYDKDITLNDLCYISNLNRTSLNQKFKQQLKCTCMDYLINYRLKISQELLSNTNMNLEEIAEHCGFKYSSYFTKQFTKRLGILPSVYRKNPLSYSAFDGEPVKVLE